MRWTLLDAVEACGDRMRSTVRKTLALLFGDAVRGMRWGVFDAVTGQPYRCGGRRDTLRWKEGYPPFHIHLSNSAEGKFEVGSDSNMLPSFSMDHEKGCLIADAENSCKTCSTLACFIPRANLQHLGSGELGTGHTFATLLALALDLVTHIVCMCARDEVGWIPTRWRIAGVAQHHVWRERWINDAHVRVPVCLIGHALDANLGVPITCPVPTQLPATCSWVVAVQLHVLQPISSCWLGWATRHGASLSSVVPPAKLAGARRLVVAAGCGRLWVGLALGWAVGRSWEVPSLGAGCLQAGGW